MPLHVSSTSAHHQVVKIALHSLWYHHTETSEWSKITKIQFYKYEQIIGFGGLGVACWPLVPKFVGSNPAEAVGSSARLPLEGK